MEPTDYRFWGEGVDYAIWGDNSTNLIRFWGLDRLYLDIHGLLLNTSMGVSGRVKDTSVC